MKRALAVLLLGLLTAGVTDAAAADWPRFGFDAARAGAPPGPTGITRADLPRLVAQRIDLPGTVDSSPVYLGGVTVGGARHDVFVVTTTYGHTIALDASTGARLWTFTPAAIGSWEGTNQYTTASPVTDRRFVYAAAPDGRIHKLAVADGTEVRTGGWPVTVTRVPVKEKLSSSLNLTGRFVIAATASFQDIGPFSGHVVTIDRNTGRIAGVFNSVCAQFKVVVTPEKCGLTGGGVWGRGGAVVEPESGRLLLSTGNALLNNRNVFGDSLLELSPDARRVRRVWNPPDYKLRAIVDLDLGSGSPAPIRHRGHTLVVQGSKDGAVRLFDLRRLRRHGRPGRMPGLLQTVHAKPQFPFVSAPVVWQRQSTVFFTNAGATFAYRVEGRKPRLVERWSRRGAGTTPVLADGVLYVYSHLDGRIVARDPASGRGLASLVAERGHWTSPIAADGRIAVGAGDARRHETTGSLLIYRVPAS